FGAAKIVGALTQTANQQRRSESAVPQFKSCLVYALQRAHCNDQRKRQYKRDADRTNGKSASKCQRRHHAWLPRSGRFGILFGCPRLSRTPKCHPSIKRFPACLTTLAKRCVYAAGWLTSDPPGKLPSSSYVTEVAPCNALLFRK